MKPKRLSVLFFGVAITAALVCAQAVANGVTTSNPNLPPDTGSYLTPDQVHAMYTAGDLEVILNKPEHKAIAQEAQRQAQGADELESFPSTLTGTGTVKWPSQGLPNPVPVSLTAQGPVQTLVHGKVGNTTGTFQTEMLSMNLTGASGLGPFMIRESPTLPSLGQTTIADIGGGHFRIDSFFDVFTELSIDGGQTWIPDSLGPARVNLVPEPSSFVLLGLGAIGLAGCVWRRRRAG